MDEVNLLCQLEHFCYASWSILVMLVGALISTFKLH